MPNKTYKEGELGGKSKVGEKGRKPLKYAKHKNRDASSKFHRKSVIREKPPATEPDFSFLQKYTMKQAVEFYKTLYDEVKGTELYLPMLAALAKQDRFFLLTHILKRPDAVHEWLYRRCREVEFLPDGRLDLWARFHYKSTIITFAGIIQEILNDPEITICIYSYNNATATSFLSQIKNEFQGNHELIELFPDILWSNPKKDAPAWSLDKGITVQRKTNPKENTVEAFGLVDNQPTGRHYKLRVYDDIVTVASVNTPEMINKTTEAWEVSLNTGAGAAGNRQWYVGTRYNANDTYHAILERHYLEPRIYAATHDGTASGDPVFMGLEEWLDIKQGVSEYVLACQQLLNPLAGSQQEFKPEWFRRWEVRPRTLNVYILCDPAGGSKNIANCNTAMCVIGVDSQLNKYLLDGACHKMSLQERWEMLKKLHRKWKTAPGIANIRVGYERYSMQADIEHFETMMRIENTYITIDEIGGRISKDDRIRRLLPDHQNWRFFYPETKQITKKMKTAIDTIGDQFIAKPIRRIDSEQTVYELSEWFMKNEYAFFPNSTKKDMLDAMSRLYDMEIVAPVDVGHHQMARLTNKIDYGGPSYYNGMCMEPDQEWVN